LKDAGRASGAQAEKGLKLELEGLDVAGKLEPFSSMTSTDPLAHVH